MKRESLIWASENCTFLTTCAKSKPQNSNKMSELFCMKTIDVEKNREERTKKATKVRKKAKAKKMAERKWDINNVCSSDEFRSFYSTLCAGNAEDPHYDFLTSTNWTDDFLTPIKKFFPEHILEKSTVMLHGQVVSIKDFYKATDDEYIEDLDDAACVYRKISELVDKVCLDNGANCVYCTRAWADCTCNTCEYCGCVAGDCKRHNECEIVVEED